MYSFNERVLLLLRSLLWVFKLLKITRILLNGILSRYVQMYYVYMQNMHSFFTIIYLLIFREIGKSNFEYRISNTDCNLVYSTTNNVDNLHLLIISHIIFTFLQ